MTPTREELEGTWISRDFPLYYYEDGLEFTLHFGKYATVYYSKKENRIIAEGTFEIEEIENEFFNII